MDKGIQKAIGLASALLAGFALLGVSLVAITYETTKDRIDEQKRQALLRGLNEIIASDQYDNALATDTIEVIDAKLLGSEAPKTIYRARKNGQPVAAVINTVSREGYDATELQILVGINPAGEVIGVRVVYHKETPGLGDKVSTQKSDWVHSFQGKSLINPGERGWTVKKQGGEFDQFSGATITPRAVVRAVHRALKFYKANRNRIYTSEEASETQVQP